MAKKYILILGKDQRHDYFSAYYKSKDSGYIIASVTLHNALHQDDFHFTKSEIDDLKSQQPTEAMRKIVDLAKVEVQEPLYYWRILVLMLVVKLRTFWGIIHQIL